MTHSSLPMQSLRLQDTYCVNPVSGSSSVKPQISRPRSMLYSAVQPRKWWFRGFFRKFLSASNTNQFLLAVVFLGFLLLDSLGTGRERTRMPSLPSRRTW